MSLVKQSVDRLETFEVPNPGRPYSKTCPSPPPSTRNPGGSGGSGGYGTGHGTCINVIESTGGPITVSYPC